MFKDLKRLLFSDEPYYDESFLGYLMRLAEMNEIPDFRWILDHISRGRHDNRYGFHLDSKIDLPTFSKLLGVSEEKLAALIYIGEYKSGKPIRVGNIMVFGVPVPLSYVRRESPKICSPCLAEGHYRRKIWELSPVTSCPYHRCLLIGNCPECDGPLGWKNSSLFTCSCGFDLLSCTTVSLDESEIRIAERLYYNFGLFTETMRLASAEVLSHLNNKDLLDLLSFVGGIALVGRDLSGLSIFSTGVNTEIHKFLVEAISIFDDWPIRFHQALKKWGEDDKSYFLTCQQAYMPNIMLPREHAQFEMINRLLNVRFSGKQFGFLHEEFITHLKGMHRVGSGDDFVFMY